MDDCGTKLINCGPFAPRSLKGLEVFICLLCKEYRYFVSIPP